jgi:hypothetical protein
MVTNGIRIDKKNEKNGRMEVNKPVETVLEEVMEGQRSFFHR